MLSALLKIEHGNLENFVSEALPTAEREPGLFAHAMAWNQNNGRVRDSKIAFPILALRTEAMENEELAQNAVACLASLDPRQLVKAYQFNKSLSSNGKTIRHGRRRMLEDALKRYLLVREASPNWWNASALRNRSAMRTLYAVAHKKPDPFAQKILFSKDYPTDSVFAVLKQLRQMDTLEAAAKIMKYKIPITVAAGAGVKLDDKDVLLALIGNMTTNELITASSQLSRLKSWQLPVVREAYSEATKKAPKDKRVNVLKASRAAKSSAAPAKELAALKEAATQSLKKIKGDWLVLADRSPSMHLSIEAGKQLAGLLAHRVEGKVHLVFFDAQPISFEVQGKSLDAIEQMTRHIGTGSATSIGCGLRWLRSQKLDVDGIVLISDGEENTVPYFPEEYLRLGAEPALYFLLMVGGRDNLSPRLEQAGIPATTFDVRSGFDYYAMTNVVNVLKPQTYGFLAEVMETPLKTLDGIFRNKKEVASC
jgi:hypothetical protein